MVAGHGRFSGHAEVVGLVGMDEAPTYRLRATAETVHLGGFSCELSAALEVESGDVVDVETFSGFYVVAEAPEAL